LEIVTKSGVEKVNLVKQKFKKCSSHTLPSLHASRAQWHFLSVQGSGSSKRSSE